MSAFSEEHPAVLRELLTVWEPARFVIIGAAAISIHIDFTWRGTQDLDLCVASEVGTYAPVLERLGWHRERYIPHRWRTPGGFRVDVLPGGPDLVRRGEVIWPESGSRPHPAWMAARGPGSTPQSKRSCVASSQRCGTPPTQNRP